MVAGDRSSYRGVLAIRDARTLIVATAASELGDWLYNAALLAYIYAATESAAWVGVATIGRLLPYMVLGPVGGLVADRYDRRAVLLGGDVARCLVMLALALVVAGEGPIVVVIAMTAAASAAGTAQRPAAMALLPRVVGESRLGAANALFHTVSNTGIVVGPAVGALILAVSPAWVAFVVNGATFAVSAAFVSTIRKRRAFAASGTGDAGDRGAGDGDDINPTGAMRELVAGVRAALTTPFVLPLFAIVAMSAFTYGAQTVQLVLYAEQRLGLGTSGYGWFLAVMGVGGVLSALVKGRFAGSARVGGIAVGAGAVFAATQLLYPTNDVVAIAMLVTLLGGVGSVVGDVVAETAIARVVPSELLGRVMGVFDALSVGAMVLGATVAPLVTAWTSLRTGMVVLGVIAIAVVLTCPLGLRGLADANRRREEQLGERIDIIESLTITADSPRLAIEQMASAAAISPVAAGIDVVVQGAPAQAFYAVVEGRVEVRRDGIVVDHIDAGGHFGERGLLDNAPRNATVRTEIDSVLLRLPGDVLLDALQLAPTLRATLDRSNVPVWKIAEPDDVAFVDDPDWPG
jgi:MFS family permease